MTDRDLAEVGARLEEAHRALSGELLPPQQQYETYELLAIQILDSEHMNYPEGALENYLMQFLEKKQSGC